MLYPNIYIENYYWKIIDDEIKQLKSDDLYYFDSYKKTKSSSLERIIALIRSSNIYTDEEINAENLNQLKDADKNIKNFILKEIIKSNAVINGRKLTFNQSPKNLESINDTCFFRDLDQEFCETKMKKTGIIHFGKNFPENGFYLSNSFPVEQTQIDISNLEKIYHPCNSLVILDNYLFTGFNKKRTYFFRFLQKLISNKLEKPFELDIVIQNPENYFLVNDINEQILAEFKNISLHIYLSHGLKNKESDRYFITNYSVISIGHPFDRESNISSNFFPSRESEDLVIQSYITKHEKLKFIKNIINQTPDMFLGNKCIIKNDEKYHRIFENLN